MPEAKISIHKALAGLDAFGNAPPYSSMISIHKALAGLDFVPSANFFFLYKFQSTRPSRASTFDWYYKRRVYGISIHKALAGLDFLGRGVIHYLIRFQSTRPSRASTGHQFGFPPNTSDFNPQGPRGPRRSHALTSLLCAHYFNPQGPRGPRQQNYPTIPPHPPNFLCIMSSPPYFNLLHPFTQPIFTAFPLFFRCESPRHFMLAWHSHLV